MRKIIAAVAAFCLVPLMFIGGATNTATAAGCGDKRFTSSNTGWVGGDNLKIAGRPLKWTFSIKHRECNGYDEIVSVGANLSKSGMGCRTAHAYNRGYKFNPNKLGSVDAGTKEVKCLSTAGNYGVSFPAYKGVRIGEYRDKNERCLNFVFTVNIRNQRDSKYTNAQSICLDGK